MSGGGGLSGRSLCFAILDLSAYRGSFRQQCVGRWLFALPHAACVMGQIRYRCPGVPENTQQIYQIIMYISSIQIYMFVVFHFS
jgi:dolichyl-phosphate-mannose--protein O-mannosyl transferase